MNLLKHVSRFLFLFLTCAALISTSQRSSRSEEQDTAQNTENTLEDSSSSESLLKRFGLLEKKEKEIDWSGLGQELGFTDDDLYKHGHDPYLWRLDYSKLAIDFVDYLLVDNPNRTPFEPNSYRLIFNGQYDEAIQNIQGYLKQFWPFIGDSTDFTPLNDFMSTGDTRQDLYAYALAAELKGEFYPAWNLYNLLYGQSERGISDEMFWADARINISSGNVSWTQGNTGLIVLCRKLQEYRGVDFEKLITEIDSVVPKKDDLIKEVPIPYSSKYYYEIRRLYTLREHCALTMNPRLHYTLWTPNTECEKRIARIVMLSRASYLAFVDYMNERYARYLESLKGGKPLEEIEAGMEVVRQLARLPY